MSAAERILLVEDEEHLARGLAFNLEAEGYRVEITERRNDFRNYRSDFPYQNDAGYMFLIRSLFASDTAGASADQAPPASTTARHAIGPCSVRTALTWPALVSMERAAQCSWMLAPSASAARASAGTARLGSARASLGVNMAPLKRLLPCRSNASVSTEDSSRVSS